ncbi:hypothetical protein BV898_15192 [Hypsibius exemplaris]|uniref:Uncharacterized protein n=1 Tax=Hypsibius exemplaris TaxID=2072580 RepID=A0A9X6NAJ1_HYPEX|nr:hypothetical protein BV898_15192 [Hypsibius exemplaris]
MAGETDLQALLGGMKPELHVGDYVYCVVHDPSSVELTDALCFFREAEGVTLILEKSVADRLNLPNPSREVMAWISLTVHSSLAAVGLTAAFSAALGDAGISCNVVAAFYHDHIFVPKIQAARAMAVLKDLSQSNLTKN